MKLKTRIRLLRVRRRHFLPMHGWLGNRAAFPEVFAKAEDGFSAREICFVA